jgi:CheY-like chemotaxis protein
MSKILVIDDDPDFVYAVRIVLEKEGHSIKHAPNGGKGFQLAKDDLPDLVILDVMMDSVLDGISTSRKLSEDAATSKIPIIMITSIASTSFADYFPTDEYLHVSSFMSKPVNPTELVKQVKRILPPQ